MSEDFEKTLREKFGLDGGEFLNTGLTLEEWCLTLQLENIANSFVVQDRFEQRRRVDYVIKLAVEGTRLREAGHNFGSVVIERSIENVMEGRWKDVLLDIDWVGFKNILVPSKEEDRAKVDAEELAKLEERERHYRDLWVKFRELLQAAYDSRSDEVETQKH